MATAHNRVSCGLDVGLATDLEFSIEKSCSETYDFICTAMAAENCTSRFSSAEDLQRIGGTSSRDFLLNSQEWCSLVVGRISSLKNLDSEDNAVQIEAEERLKEELHHAAFLGLPAVMLEINNFEIVPSAAKLCYTYLLHGHHNTHVWVKIPINVPTQNGIENDDTQVVDTWYWWNSLRTLCGNHLRVKVVLELTSDLPSLNILTKWPGEPVRALVIPTSIFLSNKKGYPVLSKAHQHFVMKLFRLDVQVIVKGPSCHMGNYRVYQQYLDHLYNLRAPPSQYESFARGYEDYLQAPLQPLMDNLDQSTYEIFEKDPVKYKQYEEAVYRCLLDRVPEEQRESTVTVLMVLGAGRGPLLRMSLKAAKRANRKVKCYAVEKNRDAAILLRKLRTLEWADDDVTIVNADMRLWNPPELADIIVSELLGSFGDNELSPECLDGANRLLKDDAISIPQSYTSYLSPLSSQKLYNEVRSLVPKDGKLQDSHFETPYVVRIHNFHELTDPKDVFTFCHPNFDLSCEAKKPQFYAYDSELEKKFEFRKVNDGSLKDQDTNMNNNNLGSTENSEIVNLKTRVEVGINDNEHNRRYKSVNFEIAHNTVVHGFAGYFRCSLYKDVEISIEPSTHSPGMFSWFPIFFPLKTPLALHQGSRLRVNFWRCCNQQKVWYEWAVVSPYPSEIHNPNGRSYVIGL